MHGIPGIIGGIISGFVILIYFHNRKSIRKDLVELKFFELPKNNFTDQELQTIIGQQFGAPFICMGIAIITGIVIGFSLKLLMKFSCIKQLDKNSQLTGF